MLRDESDAAAGEERDLDAIAIGKRVRALRTRRGMTVTELGRAIGRAASQVSVIERGRRDLRLAELQRLARALGVGVDELLDDAPLSRRDELEIALERAQRGPLFASLGIEPVPIRSTLPDRAIETVLALHDELARLHRERAATPEVARIANAQLRAEQRRRGNHYPELEAVAADLLRAIGHRGGPLSQRACAELAAQLGFTLHYVGDLPVTTRSITDERHRRIYLPLRQPGTDPRSALLHALAQQVLGHGEPGDYGALLRQRVETNYLAAALLIPESSAVPYLSAAKRERQLSVEDLRDHFAVSYETAAHRFTNLATRHLGIPVHFLKVHPSGAVSKAYENDDVRLPTDALGAVEGQRVCRWWSARQVFEIEDRLSPYHQYTDKPTGTYWCTSSIQSGPNGDVSLSVGTRFAEAKWFRGRDTVRRRRSNCPDPTCCREPVEELAERWGSSARAGARLDPSLLAAMPQGPVGVDRVDVYEFLDRHAPD